MGRVIVVVGPTAVGKTKISIELAKNFQCEIISGDSVAVYRGLDIGSAKPTLEERQGIVHHLIGIKDPKDQYNVADFQKEARKIMDTKSLSMICGGTGLYIQSVLFNYEFEAKKRDFDFEKQYEGYSNQELYDLLLQKDSQIDREKLHPNNRKRVLRALEIMQTSERKVSEINGKKESLYEHFIVYLSMPREQLYERINQRVDQMITEGLIDEVFDLYQKGIFPHAIGYQEFIPYFENKIRLETAIEEIKKNTRHLAKRQETWFRNQMDCHFYSVNLENIDETIQTIESDIKGWLEQ